MPDATTSDSDPLIDEVRQIRREVSDRFDNDPRRLCEHLQIVQKQAGRTVIKRRRRSGTDHRAV